MSYRLYKKYSQMVDMTLNIIDDGRKSNGRRKNIEPKPSHTPYEYYRWLKSVENEHSLPLINDDVCLTCCLTEISYQMANCHRINNKNLTTKYHKSYYNNICSSIHSIVKANSLNGREMMATYNNICKQIGPTNENIIVVMSRSLQVNNSTFLEPLQLSAQMVVADNIIFMSSNDDVIDSMMENIGPAMANLSTDQLMAIISNNNNSNIMRDVVNMTNVEDMEPMRQDLIFFFEKFFYSQFSSNLDIYRVQTANRSIYNWINNSTNNIVMTTLLMWIDNPTLANLSQILSTYTNDMPTQMLLAAVTMLMQPPVPSGISTLPSLSDGDVPFSNYLSANPNIDGSLIYDRTNLFGSIAFANPDRVV